MQTIISPPRQEHLRGHHELLELPPSLDTVLDEHDLYPAHEDETVPSNPLHFWQNNYVAYAIQSARKDLWIIGETCLYWQKGRMDLWRAPDVAAIAGPAPAVWASVYLRWTDNPLLFVAEVGSRSTKDNDKGPKKEIYEQSLIVPEYLYTEETEAEGRLLCLWRMEEGHYRLIPADKDGRVWSEQLGLGFGYDDADFFRVYTPEGRPLPTYDEAQAAVTIAEVALMESEAKRRDAEAARAVEIVARNEAEAQRAQAQAERAQAQAERAQAQAARDEAEQRARLSEQRSQEEVAARMEVERRMEAMAAELERLQAGRD